METINPGNYVVLITVRHPVTVSEPTERKKLIEAAMSSGAVVSATVIGDSK